MNESEKQFSFTRAASSTSGRARKQFLIDLPRLPEVTVLLAELFELLALLGREQRGDF